MVRFAAPPPNPNNAAAASVPRSESVRFGGAAYTSAAGADISNQSKKRSAAGIGQVTQHRPASACGSVAEGAFPMEKEGSVSPAKPGKRRTDPYGGPTLQGCSLNRAVGNDVNRLRRANSLERQKQEAAAESKPKVRNLLSDRFKAVEPTKARKNEERYEDSALPKNRGLKRVQPSTAATCLVAPWEK